MKLLFRVVSFILLAGLMGWQIYTGMYDLSAVTTADVLRNWRLWNGREIELTNVSIRNYEMRQYGTDTLIRLQLVNGQTNPSDTEDAVWVVGKMPTDEANSFESLPWCLEKYQVKRLTRAHVSIDGDMLVLTQYGLPLDQSWFTTPYWFTVNTMNRFASLHTSVVAGAVFQAIVYVVAAIFVAEGAIYIVPDV